MNIQRIGWKHADIKVASGQSSLQIGWTPTLTALWPLGYTSACLSCCCWELQAGGDEDDRRRVSQCRKAADFSLHDSAPFLGGGAGWGEGVKWKEFVDILEMLADWQMVGSWQLFFSVSGHLNLWQSFSGEFMSGLFTGLNFFNFFNSRVPREPFMMPTDGISHAEKWRLCLHTGRTSVTAEPKQ